jgi:hypothetical protein
MIFAYLQMPRSDRAEDNDGMNVKLTAGPLEGARDIILESHQKRRHGTKLE